MVLTIILILATIANTYNAINLFSDKQNFESTGVKINCAILIFVLILSYAKLINDFIL